jgi:glycosidase
LTEAEGEANRLKLDHQSRLPMHRDPGGAVPAGTVVSFAISVQPAGQSVDLCYAYGLYQFRESRIHLVADDLHAGGAQASEVFRGSLRMPAEPCLFFYWFEAETADGHVCHTRNTDNMDGSGTTGSAKPRYLPGEAHMPAAWQITVYAPDFQVPEWLPGSVFYQIFPDRFRRDGLFDSSRFAASATDTSERIFHEDWSGDVDIHGRPETGYIATDFFGGSLAGIREKLDYIASLGVTIIYLNPIFQARSNHRYDTGDYERIDPLLGDEAAFRALCGDAAARGIRIMLDGVFSHTGADSRYFNKYERYPERGAWQQANGHGPSPYGSWYRFQRRDGRLSYDSWWGFPDLPNVNENDLSYRDYIAGPKGVVRHWLDAGAAGWRLDVSDELPDSFIRDLRRAAKAAKPDAIIMGEVWEDASAKISYGNYRDFLLGRSHDIVMGYPYRQALLGWLTGYHPADYFWRQLETIRENYPLPSFYSSFNLIGSHDVARALTVLAGKPDPGNREVQAGLQLTAGETSQGQALLRLAVFFQMTYPGCPSIYYGDEAGAEGYGDPFNRRTFPWGREDEVLVSWFAALGALRRDTAVLRTGAVSLIYAQGDCIVFERSLSDGRDVFGNKQTGAGRILAALNRSRSEVAIQIGERCLTLPPQACQLEIDGQTVILPAIVKQPASGQA